MFYHREPKTNNTENRNHFKCQIIQLLLELAEISSAELLLVPGGTPPPSLGSWLRVEEVSHEKFRSPRCNIMCNHFAVNISSLRSLYSILDQQCIKITLLHLVRLNKLNSFFSYLIRLYILGDLVLLLMFLRKGRKMVLFKIAGYQTQSTLHILQEFYH